MNKKTEQEVMEFISEAIIMKEKRNKANRSALISGILFGIVSWVLKLFIIGSLIFAHTEGLISEPICIGIMVLMCVVFISSIVSDYIVYGTLHDKE